MSFEDQELLQDFLEEAFDMLEQCNRTLEGLTTGGAVQDGLNSLFRGIHTIKGGSGMFSFTRTQAVAHELESFLADLKNQAPKELSNETLHFIQSEVDKLEQLLKAKDQLEVVANVAPAAPSQTEVVLRESHFFSSFYEQFDELIDEFEKKRVSQFEVVLPTAKKDKIIEILDRAKITLMQEDALADNKTAALFIFNENDFSNVDQILKKLSFLENPHWIQRFENKVIPLPEVSVKKEEKAATPTTTEAAAAPQDMLRVPLERVNQVLDNAWEMFLISNQMSYLMEQHRHQFKENISFVQAFEALENQLKRNIKEIESRTMSMRMSSVKNIFTRMQKVVRSYSTETGKAIEFITLGENIELDKKVIDMLGEPLIHLVRNAMDHGIEDESTRVSHGKPRAGKITLNAQLSGNIASIEITDDGKGMNPQAILESAQRKGIDVSHVQNDDDALQLIFKAGFSTVEQVSNVSGRGVGMDAVRTSVESLGGNLTIHTKLNKGSTFRIELSMGMSVISALIVKINKHLYAFNSENIIQTQRISEFQLKHNGDDEYYNYNGEYIPCFSLKKIFYDGSKKHHEGIDTMTSVCVVSTPQGMIALRVDEVLQSVGLVAKPTPNLCPHEAFIAGVSLLQSGHPVILLSVEKIAKSYSIKSWRQHERSA